MRLLFVAGTIWRITAKQPAMPYPGRYPNCPEHLSAIRYVIDFIGAPEEIRTPDPQIRSLVLYPAELRARPVDGGRVVYSGWSLRKGHRVGSNSSDFSRK